MAKRVIMYENYWLSDDGIRVIGLKEFEDYILPDKWADRIIKLNYGMELDIDAPDNPHDPFHLLGNEKMDTEVPKNKMEPQWRDKTRHKHRQE
jgi:hypothetical protein